MDKDLLNVIEVVQNRSNYLANHLKNKKVMDRGEIMDRGELYALNWILQIINDQLVTYDEETYQKMVESKKECNICDGILIHFVRKYNGTYESYAPGNYGKIFKEHLIDLKETNTCMIDNTHQEDNNSGQPSTNIN
jgi:Na+/phosphate symporter